MTDDSGDAIGGDESVLAILRAQHVTMRELITEVADTAGVDRQHAFDALRELLAAHEAAEELVLRPFTRLLARHGVTTARDGEEQQIAEMLADLEKLDVDSREFAEAFGRLTDAVLAHTWLEEAEEFPAVEVRMSVDERRRLGGWIGRALDLAPTHPHPVAAGSSVAQWTVGPFTMLLDRARDGIAQARQALDPAAIRKGEW